MKDRNRIATFWHVREATCSKKSRLECKKERSSKKKKINNREAKEKRDKTTGIQGEGYLVHSISPSLP